MTSPNDDQPRELKGLSYQDMISIIRLQLKYVSAFLDIVEGQLTDDRTSVTTNNRRDSVGYSSQRCRNCGIKITQRCCPKCDWLNVEYNDPKEEAEK